MQVKTDRLRQALAVGPDEIKTLQKVNWHPYCTHFIFETKNCDQIGGSHG